MVLVNCSTNGLMKTLKLRTSPFKTTFKSVNTSSCLTLPVVSLSSVSCPIVERLTNSLMMHGRNNGKKLMAARIVQHAFEIIHLLTDANPLQILVDAIINCGPREDSTRIGSQGTVRRQAVDVSPLRRVNQAISLLTIGAREAAFRNIKTIAECLADELINAAKGSANSYAIKKKDELERVAKSNR
ncbi:Putative 40S ribosomal protein S5 [Rhizopus microsporus]|nr:Putative 40S ribosomal protein S5 [Rhizopus microsporus]